MRHFVSGSLAATSVSIGALCLATFAGCSQAAPTDTAPAEAVGEAEQPSSAAPTCITLQRGVSGVVRDALLNAQQPDKNFGATGSLTAGVSNGVAREALIGFDLSMLSAGSTIVSATLTLNQLLPSGVAKPVRVHRALSAWSEATVTWNSFGGARASQVEAQIAPVTSFTNVSTDLTALVQQWVDGGAPNHGIVLERDLDGSTVYASSEGIAAQRPALTVCYVPPFCQGQPDGTPCDDGVACTTGDACHGGVCGGTTVTCTAPDACHGAGTCDPTTGQCGAAPAVANGTLCDDGDPNTVGDQCQAGHCAGVDHCLGVVCAPIDQCHAAGACVDHATGACSNPAAADGTACNDGDPNTVNDVCTAGLCAGQNLCLGVACPAPADACHVQGVCNQATGLCSNPTAPDGTACDDGDPNTVGDSCTAGACAGVDHCVGVVCTAQDQCHTAGTCDHATGACSAGPAKADGTACNDGSASTSGDRCLAGVCAPTATCSDGVQNQGESGIDCGGPCAACGGTTAGNAGLSCLDLLQHGTTTSGTYWIKPTGAASAFQVSCDMVNDGGGWTLAFDDMATNTVYQSISAQVGAMPITSMRATRATGGVTVHAVHPTVTSINQAFSASWIFTGFETDYYKPLGALTGNATTTIYIMDDSDIAGGCTGRQTSAPNTPRGIISFGYTNGSAFADAGTCDYTWYGVLVRRLQIR